MGFPPVVCTHLSRIKAAMIVFLFLVMGLSAARASLTRPLNQSHTIVLIGPISSGKSALANALLGCDPRNSSCGCDCDLLNVHSDNHVDESFTTNTTMITGKWRGNGTNIKVSLHDKPFCAQSKIFLVRLLTPWIRKRR